MTRRHEAACERFDEDRTAKIKERVEPASWDFGPLIVRDVAASWPFEHSSAKWMAQIFQNLIFYKSIFYLSKLNF